MIAWCEHFGVWQEMAGNSNWKQVLHWAIWLIAFYWWLIQLIYILPFSPNKWRTEDGIQNKEKTGKCAGKRMTYLLLDLSITTESIVDVLYKTFRTTVYERKGTFKRRMYDLPIYVVKSRGSIHLSILHFPIVVSCHYKLTWAAELKNKRKQPCNPDWPGCRHMAKAYLAVCSTDRKSNIGSYHNCERRSQLNSESTAGSIRKHFTVTLFSSF